MRSSLLVLACLVLPAQTRDPATDPLDQAYRCLKEKDYLQAIEHFLRAAQAAPDRASIRKELGYAYLRIGETEAAREAFEQALSLDPQDHRTALELAFLAHETGREARALDLFDRVRQRGDPESARTAAEAFARVDTALRQAITRWEAAAAQDPANRAARLELAEWLEKHREPAAAAQHYLAAWRLPPRREETLLALGRARWDAGDAEGAVGAWLVASRSPQTRVAERARLRLPPRHPYANEYRRALELDPANTALRRELAFLWLAVGRDDEALRELQTVVEQDANDLLAAAQLAFLFLDRGQPERAAPLLEKVAAGSDADLARRAREALRRRGKSAAEYKLLGEKSLALSYLPDALRYLRMALENDPGDLDAAYKLGVVQNLLGDDQQALRYFAQASRSADPKVAAAARRAYRNLTGAHRRLEFTVWALPIFSSRYHDAFHYAQAKTEFRLGRLPVRPYLSLRLIGDWKRRTPAPLLQFLSESSLIAGLGLRSVTWRGLTLWAEAGQAASYLRQRPPGTPRLGPDYRGGLNWSRRLGAPLGSETGGWFTEFSADSVFLSRFQNNVITYWQMRQGWTLRAPVQVFWNTNFTFDRRRDDYANYVEIGPGVRFRLPARLDVTISALRGNYFVGERPDYHDLRVGLWYAAVY